MFVYHKGVLQIIIYDSNINFQKIKLVQISSIFHSKENQLLINLRETFTYHFFKFLLKYY